MAMRIVRYSALVLAAWLAGCAADLPHLMATPLIYKDERIDFVAQVPPQRRTTQVPVFYATTRQPVGDGEEGFYNNEPNNDRVQLGVAHVRLGEPGWSYNELAASDRTSTVDKPRPGRLERVEVVGDLPRGASARTDAERAFVERIDRHIATLKNPEIVVYVHGYRVTFDEVAVLAGSLSTYLGQGATVAFQWPTGQHWWNYLSDCPNSEKYIPDIARTIELLGRTRAEYINLLAYSCGSPLLASALRQLRAQHPDETREQLTKRFRIGSVVFAASDVDLKTFAREDVPAIMDLAQQTTVYISRKDAALGFSTLVAGVSRIGRPDIANLSRKELENLAADPRLYAIDVTDVRGAHEMGGMAGHGYWYSNEWIATDVLLSLRYPLPPEKRCLVQDKKYTKIWHMPDDYPDCVANGLLKAFPYLRRTSPQ